MNAPTPFTHFEGHQYVALTTFRKSGAPVVTPVWFVQQGARLVIWTAQESGKVKRLKKNPCVRLGPSTHSGKLLGSLVDGRARLVPDSQAAAVEQAFKVKYGWLRGLFALQFQLQRHAHIYIEIVPAEAAASQRVLVPQRLAEPELVQA